MVDWLTSTAIHVLGYDISWAEVLGDVTGAFSVWWAARERVGTWPIGILNSALFLVLFLDAKLYADSILQVAFIVLGVYGWWRWLAGSPTGVGELEVRRTAPREWLVLGLVTVAAQAAWTAWLAWHTDSPAPFWDAALLVLSLVATYGQAKKLVESWWIWILVDVISVPLYLSRDLAPTAILFAAFGLMCVVGLRDWTRALHQVETPIAVGAP